MEGWIWFSLYMIMIVWLWTIYKTICSPHSFYPLLSHSFLLYISPFLSFIVTFLIIHSQTFPLTPYIINSLIHSWITYALPLYISLINSLCNPASAMGSSHDWLGLKITHLILPEGHLWHNIIKGASSKNLAVTS